MSDTILPSGYVLKNYKIEKMLGDGGFGITYLARDISLDKVVAIKEYFPKEFAYRSEDMTVCAKSTTDREDYDRGLERFLEEGKTLAKFDDPAIARVLLFFEENDTAYLVMEFVPGPTVSQRLRENGAFPVEEASTIIKALCHGLAKVHAMDVLHRDIKPGNIILRDNGMPVLIDFGAAKSFSGDNATMTAIWTPGYGAKEQMSTEEQQGPYTDIYGLAAVAYTMVMRKRPPDVTTRWPKDNYEPLAGEAQNEDEAFLFPLIDLGLQVDKSDRPQNIDDWLSQARSIKQNKNQADVIVFDEPETQIASSGGQFTQPTTPTQPPPEPGGNKRPMIAGGLIALAAIVIVIAFFLQEGGSDDEPVIASNTATTPDENAPAEENEDGQDTPESEPPTPATPKTETQLINVSANEWVRIELPPSKLENGQFGITADKPYRIRNGDKVYLINSRSTMARSLGEISASYIEVKGAQGPVELTVSY